MMRSWKIVVLVAAVVMVVSALVVAIWSTADVSRRSVEGYYSEAPSVASHTLPSPWDKITRPVDLGSVVESDNSDYSQLLLAMSGQLGVALEQIGLVPDGSEKLVGEPTFYSENYFTWDFTDTQGSRYTGLWSFEGVAVAVIFPDPSLIPSDITFGELMSPQLILGKPALAFFPLVAGGF